MLAPPTKYNIYFKRSYILDQKNKNKFLILFIFYFSEKMVKNISEGFLEISDIYNEQLLTHKKKAVITAKFN